jgi:hypothetical protein
VTREPPFWYCYTTFGVWPRDHYMLLQRFTIGHMSGLAKLVYGTIAMLRFLGAWVNGHATSHSFEQFTLPTTSLISKQVVPYWTRGGTYCHGVSTSKIQSLTDSSITNHKMWRSQPSPPFQTLLKAQHRISPQSPHITTDGRPTLSILNTSQTQHHKDGKTCMTTQDCRAKQCYSP